MTITFEQRPKAIGFFHLTIPVAEHTPFLEKAAEEIGKNLKVDGFRAGHIPFDIVKKQVGEMALLETASEAMIKKGLVQGVLEHKIETVGAPNVNIKKMVPGNDLEVDVEWSLLPTVTLPDLETISITQKKAKVEDKEVDDAVGELRRMRASEVVSAEAAGKTDRVVVDMTISLDKVPVEGGTTKDHSVYLDEQAYIPGLTEQLLGLKKDETKLFDLSFPEKYYNKMLAGKTAQFDVKVKEVYARTLPELNEEFAKTLGQESVEKLLSLLRENLLTEAEKKSKETAHAEMIDTLIQKSEFSEIPEILITAEKERLFAEFKAHLEEGGITIDQYLADIKKTVEEVAEGFTDKGVVRIKGSLVLRNLAKLEGIVVSDDELQQEIVEVRRAYQENPNIDDRLKDQNIIEYIKMNLTHRKATQKLAERLVKKEAE